MVTCTNSPVALDAKKLLGFRHLSGFTGDAQKAKKRMDRALIKCGFEELPPADEIVASVGRVFNKIGDGELPT